MCLHLGFGQAHTNYTQINTLGRLILTTLFYFSYTSHKPCSLLLLFLISVKKGNNHRWLKVQETFNFRMAIFVHRESDLVDLFDVRMHHHLVNTGMLQSFLSLFIPSQVFLWSWSRLLLWSCSFAGTQSMGSLFSIFLCCGCRADWNVSLCHCFAQLSASCRY